MMHSLYGSLYHHDPLAAAAAVAMMDPSLASSNNAAAAAVAAAAFNGGASTKDTTFTKIFVGGLPYHTTDKTLREYFEKYGDIEEAVVITDRQTGKSRGYGFVTMKDRTSAEQACKDPNPIIDGRKANVNLAYLGAKPRNNLQLAGLSLPLQASIPTLLPSRIGLPQLYYPSAQGLVPVSSLAANQYLDYSALAAAANQLNQAAAATSAANGASPAAYEPLSYTATAYGMMPTVSFASHQNAAASLGAAQGLTTANAAFAAAAYQAAVAAAAANERQ